MPTAIMRIQVATLPDVNDGESRNDGQSGLLVTVTSVGTGTTHVLTLINTTDPTPPTITTLTGTTWSFTPTSGAGHTYILDLSVDDGGPAVSTRRTYRIPTANLGFLIPGPNESADPDATLQNESQPAIIEASFDNFGDNAFGWQPAMDAWLRELDTWESPGGDLGGTMPNPEVNDLTITGEVQGSVLYFDGANWVHLGPGTAGHFLQTAGAGADPLWAAAAGGGSLPHVITDNTATTIIQEGSNNYLVADASNTTESLQLVPNDIRRQVEIGTPASVTAINPTLRMNSGTGGAARTTTLTYDGANDLLSGDIDGAVQWLAVDPNALALGAGASVGAASSVALGAGAATTATNQIVIGSDATPLTALYFNGVTSTTADAIVINGAGGSGTDNAGANLTFAGGQGTGAGAGGELVFQTAPVSGSSSTPNALVERARITDGGVLFLGNGETNASAADGTAQGTGGSGTDNPGGSLFFNGGAGTGAGAGGDLVFQTAAVSGSSSTPNAQVERLRIDDSGTWLLAGAPGTSGQVLTSGGAGGAVSWTTLSSSGTVDLTFTINSDASAAVDEDPCLVLLGGDGVAPTNDDIVRTQICQDSPAEFTAFTMQRNRNAAGFVEIAPNFQLGVNAAVAALNPILQWNSGTGGAARTATLTYDGANDALIGDLTGSTQWLFADPTQIVLGTGASSAGTNTTAVGSQTSAGHNDVIVLGHSATSTAANQMVVGGTTAEVHDSYFGNGVAVGAPVDHAIHASGGSGTDIAGGDLTLAGGISTGSGLGGALILQTSPASGSSSTPNTLVERFRVADDGIVYVGNGVTAATANDGTIQGTGGSGTDIAAGDLFFNGGQGTGTGAGGELVFSTATPGGSGATPNALVERFRIDDTGAWLLASAAGSANQVLTSNGAGTPPTWQSAGAAATGTNNLTYTVNEDASAAVDEDPCLILLGGDGVAPTSDDIVRTQLCQDSPAEFTAFTMQRNRNAGGFVEIAPNLQLGVNAAVAALNPVLQWNSGTGGAARAATLTYDGTNDAFSGDLNGSTQFLFADASALALGAGAAAASADSVALGAGATVTATNQIVIGSDASPLTALFFNGVTSTTADAITINGAGGSGTDNAGANITFAGGQGTGTGAGGELVFSTATPAGGSGSSANALVERFRIDDDGAWLLASAAGSANQVITSNGAGAAPTWQSVGASATGTNNLTFTINEDASAGSDEDPCLVLLGGDGVAPTNDDIVRTQLCQDSPAEFTAFTMQRNRNAAGFVEIAPNFQLGVNGATAALNPVLQFNSGTGGAARVSDLTYDGANDTITWNTDASTRFLQIAPTHTSLGYNTDASTTADSVQVGSTARAAGNRGVALGHNTFATIDAISIGNDARATSGGDQGVLIGSEAINGAFDNTVVLGYFANNGGERGICIGAFTNIDHDDCIVIGSGTSAQAATTATNQCIIGSDQSPMTSLYFNGVTSTTADAIVINGAGGSGTDNAGADLTFAGGAGTGTGIGGELIFQTAPVSGTSSTPNTLVERLRITDGGIVFVGNGETNATANDGTVQGTGGSGTDVAGGDLFFSGGQGTGTGAGGELVFSTATPGSTSSTPNALVERFRIDDDGAWLLASAAGTATQVLTSNGAGTPPTWQAGGGGSTTGTDNLTWTVNENASAGTDEDPCLILLGGDGVAPTNDDIVRSQFCQDSTAEFLAFTMQRNRNAAGFAEIAPNFQIGVNGATAALNPTLQFNSGTGAATRVSDLTYNGTDDSITWNTDASTRFLFVDSNTTAFGFNTDASSSAESVQIGSLARSIGSRSVAMGHMATANIDGVSIGNDCRVASSPDQLVLIGSEADATSGDFMVGIGYAADVNTATGSSIGIGAHVNVDHGHCIVIGSGTTAQDATTADNQAIFGSSQSHIADLYFNGVTSTTPDAIVIHGAGGSGTDIAGADVTFAGGAGTGTGIGGELVFETAPPSGTSSTPNTLVERMRITDNGVVHLGDFGANTAFDPVLQWNSGTGGATRVMDITYDGTNDATTMTQNGAQTMFLDVNQTGVGVGVAVAGADAAAFGDGASAPGDRSVALGAGTQAGAECIAIGQGAQTGTTTIGSVIIGEAATMTNAADESVAVGWQASVIGQNSVGLGANVNIDHDNCIVIASGDTSQDATTATGQCIIGSNLIPISNVYFNGASSATPDDIVINAAGSSGAAAGADITLAAGTSTSGSGGAMSLSTAATTTLTERVHITNAGLVGINTAASPGGFPQSLVHIYDNDSGTAAQLNIEQDGEGDAAITFELSTVETWTVGVDHSNADSFTVALGTALGTDNKFWIQDAAGAMHFKTHENAVTTDSARRETFRQTVSGGAGATSVWTHTIGASQTVHVEAHVAAIEAGGAAGASYVSYATFTSNALSTSSQIGTTFDAFERESDSTWDITLSINTLTDVISLQVVPDGTNATDFVGWIDYIVAVD